MRTNEKVVLWLSLACGGSLLAGPAFLVLAGFGREAENRRIYLAAAQKQLAAIEQAVRFYSGRLGAFPPSDPAEVAKCGRRAVGNDHATTGAEALHVFLRGWYVLEDGTVVRGDGFRRDDSLGSTHAYLGFYTDDASADVSATDGEHGFGGAPKGVFLADRYGHKRPILYFRADPDVPDAPFDRAQNAAILDRWPAPDAVAFEGITENRARQKVEFLLWSAGPDGLFGNEDDVLLP